MNLETMSLTDINKGWNRFPNEIKNRILARYPLFSHIHTFDYSEIILRGEKIKDAEFVGPAATKFYNGGGDFEGEFSRLFRVAPRTKYLVFDLKEGFITETRKRNDAESFLNKKRILVWRER